MITAEQYITHLLSTPDNHTCTHLAEHLDGVSHDVVSDCLRTKRITARDRWYLVQTTIVDSADACLIVDDRVQDKRYSQCLELPRLYRITFLSLSTQKHVTGGNHAPQHASVNAS